MGQMGNCEHLLTQDLPGTLIQLALPYSTWRLTPKQDHLVCFLGGSLMLGATRTGALVHPVSVPPKPEELSEKGKRDWKTGVELIQTCMHTHDTATYVPGEFAVDLKGCLLETCWFLQRPLS